MSTDIFMQGLSLSLLGILFTFSALGLFILVILLLQRLFPAGTEQEHDDDAGDAVEASIDVLPTEEQEIAAAIAVAIQQVRTRRQSRLGSALEAGRGYWWKRNQS